MKLALIGDLHGNLPATEAIAREIELAGADEIWYLGDAVGKGPSNAETCDWVMENCTVCVGGNWDYGIGGREYEADQYYWDQLGEERMKWLRSLHREAEITMSGIRFRLFHGRPVTPLMMVTHPRDAMEACFRTEQGDYGGVIFADSHRPFVRTLNTGYIINSGSVGNSIGVNRAHALLLEGDMGAAEPSSLRTTILSVPYDIDRAVRMAMESRNMPNRGAYITEITTGIYAR